MKEGRACSLPSQLIEYSTSTYQIEDEWSEESGSVPSDVDDSGPLAAQLRRDEFHSILQARIHGDGDKEATGHGQNSHHHCPA